MQDRQLRLEVQQATIIEAKYEGYLVKQDRLIANLKTLDRQRIPGGLDYEKIEHLRGEGREKLSTFQPETLGQASRIGGITPADITVLQVHLKKVRGMQGQVVSNR